jgi:hypothetical protein
MDAGRDIDVSKRDKYFAPTSNCKGKAIPLQAWTGYEGFGGLESQISRQSKYKGAKLSALGTGRFYPPENIPGTLFC